MLGLSLGRRTAAMAAVMAIGAVCAAYCASDGYGMGLEAFSSDKTSAHGNEAFTVTAQVKNISADKFPGGPTGAALVDNNGGIAAVVGEFNGSFKGLNPGESFTAKINCSVPGNAAPGQYRLMIVVRPKGKEWKTVEASANGNAAAIPFTLGSKDAAQPSQPSGEPAAKAVANNAAKDNAPAPASPQTPPAAPPQTAPPQTPPPQILPPPKEPKPEQAAEAKAKHDDAPPKKSESRQIEDIRAKWQQYKPKPVTTVFAETPSVTNPYKPGALTPEFLDNGLNMFKFARYVAGLSENIVYTDELNDLGQHGAVILAAIGKLTHTPSKPDDMSEEFYKRAYKSTKTANIHWGTSKSLTLQNAVAGFLDDSGESNIDRLGHRRWMLNPPLGRVGFGYAASSAGGYIPIQVFDKSNTEKTDMDYVLWPNKGYFPTNLFSTRQAWSVSLSPKSYDLIRCKPTVKLTSLNTGRVWEFSSSDSDKKGKYFNVEKNGFGMPFCIIFRPDGISSLEAENRFKAEVGGVVDKSGKVLTIVYEVEFFTL